MIGFKNDRVSWAHLSPRGKCQAVEKPYAERPEKSNSATWASNLIFSERKRRKNEPFSQACARKIVRFSASRSFLLTRWKSSDFHRKCQKDFFDTLDCIRKMQFSLSHFSKCDCKTYHVAHPLLRTAYERRILHMATNLIKCILLWWYEIVYKNSRNDIIILL